MFREQAQWLRSSTHSAVLSLLFLVHAIPPKSQTRGEKQMPLFLDVHHHVPGAKAKDVADAHMKDLKAQGKYGVKYINYCLDESKGEIFGLVDSPSKQADEKA